MSFLTLDGLNFPFFPPRAKPIINQFHFSSVPSESFRKEATLFEVMEQNVEQQSKGDVKETNNGTNSNKCSGEDVLRKQKSNKCNQCEYKSSQADNLRRHLKKHSGEKPNKCNQCDFACSDPSSLWRHMKRHRPV